MQFRSDVDKAFDDTIERVLSNVQVVATGKSVTSIILGDFKIFSSFFESHKNPVTGLVDAKFIGITICRILKQHWKDESFGYGKDDGVTYGDTGSFKFTFYGSVHTITLHAYIDVEQTGRHGSVHKVDVYVGKDVSPGFCMVCSCCFDP